MITFRSISDLVTLATQTEKPISSIVLEWETERSECQEDLIWEQMKYRLEVMKQAVMKGISQKEKSFSNLVGGDAFRIAECNGFVGPLITKAITYALAVSEVNANMGRIVACPTAGSCGIVPGTILAIGNVLTLADDQLIRALFTAAGFGEVVSCNATVSGAVGGCQAECGAAAAMAAAAAVELLGGTPRQASHGFALALKNLLGLVCDPVAGLVEVPCVKRNAFAASHALVAAQMAVAGIESTIPADEVIEAMYRIGRSLPSALRETSEGGLAKTPTALEITRRLEKQT